MSIYKPIQFRTLTSILGGYEWARIEHFTLTILFSLFFLVHIIQVVLAGWNNFQSMVTGLFLIKDDKKILSPMAIPIIAANEDKMIVEKSEIILPGANIHEDISPHSDNEDNIQQDLKTKTDE